MDSWGPVLGLSNLTIYNIEFYLNVKSFHKCGRRLVNMRPDAQILSLANIFPLSLLFCKP